MLTLGPDPGPNTTTDDASSSSALQVLKYVALAPLAILFLPLAAIAFLGLTVFMIVIVIIAMPLNMIAEHFEKRRLKSQGRLIRKAEVQRHLLSGEGTLILPVNPFKWLLHEAWWTPDDIEKIYDGTLFDQDTCDRITTEQLRTQELLEDYPYDPWDRWCREHYLDRTSGTARRVNIRMRWRTLDQWRRDVPEMRCVYTFGLGSVPREDEVETDGQDESSGINRSANSE